MTTHVFIVDKTTFKLHLEYLFAGTGAKENTVDFNNQEDTELKPQTEKMLTEMIADASRIRSGDLIIFYLQQNIQQKIFEGKFYGIFKAKNNWSFLDNNDNNQYLRGQLQKSLTFRTLIEPYQVYAQGVTEWEALDEIKDVRSPNQMLWSLIYRKLKGNRGNTMITIYESERLCQLIRNKNNRAVIQVNNRTLSFDAESEKIISLPEPQKTYEGRSQEINILPRLLRKSYEQKAFEVHLQAYIVKNIGQRIISGLDNIIIANSSIEWIGNEVYCGVGMQKIDLLLSLVEDNHRILVPIELKSKQADESSVKQMQRYVDWIKQYYIPNRQSDIKPTLIAIKNNSKRGQKYQSLIRKILEFNQNNHNECHNLRYIELTVEQNRLFFEDIPYDTNVKHTC